MIPPITTTGFAWFSLHPSSSFQRLTIGKLHFQVSLLVLNENRTVRIYDASTGTESGVAFSMGQTGYIRAIAISPDDKTLAVGCNDSSIILYDMGTRSMINQPIRGHNGVSA
jgi:WD40 repeat protein